MFRRGATRILIVFVEGDGAIITRLLIHVHVPCSLEEIEETLRRELVQAENTRAAYEQRLMRTPEKLYFWACQSPSASSVLPGYDSSAPPVVPLAWQNPPKYSDRIIPLRPRSRILGTLGSDIHYQKTDLIYTPPWRGSQHCPFAQLPHDIRVMLLELLESADRKTLAEASRVMWKTLQYLQRDSFIAGDLVVSVLWRRQHNLD